jgi:hypothetical protein
MNVLTDTIPPATTVGLYGSEAYIKRGREYFDDRDNISKPGYTPYAYPHPLTVSGVLAGNVTPPPAPSPTPSPTPTPTPSPQPSPQPQPTPSPTPTPTPSYSPSPSPTPSGVVSSGGESGSTKFTVGQRIRTTTTIAIRNRASSNGTLLGTQVTGSLGTVISGGTLDEEGVAWWNINYDNGVDGYTIEKYLGSNSGSSGVTPNPTSTTKKPLILTKTLSLDSRNSEVTLLQNFLIQNSYLAPGNNTGYFGALTRAAVRQYQCVKMQICSGGESTTGWGMVGRLTRAQLAK